MSGQLHALTTLTLVKEPLVRCKKVTVCSQWLWEKTLYCPCWGTA